MAYLISLIKLPYNLVKALGIIFYVKDGIEYLLYDHTLLIYNGFDMKYKDIDVQGRTMHQVASTYKYKIVENTRNDRVNISLLWGSEDPYFNNNLELMRIAAGKYYY